MKYPHVDYSRLPEHMQAGIKDYVEHGTDPGGFLYAVLTNNLVEAFGKADGINFDHMHVWAAWLWNDAPSACWGSAEKVAAWANEERGRSLVHRGDEAGCSHCGEPTLHAPECVWNIADDEPA